MTLWEALLRGELITKGVSSCLSLFQSSRPVWRMVRVGKTSHDPKNQTP